MALIDLSKLWCKDDQIEALKKENEKLNKWLDLKSEYIAKLEDENAKLKELLKECRSVIHGAFLVCPKEMCNKIDEVLK